METEEIVKLLIVIFILVILIGAVIFLLKGKGGEILVSIRDLFRFGG